MNTVELKKYLQNNEYTRIYFKGVFACNNVVTLPSISKYFIIVNTDKSDEKGEHWIVFFYNNNILEIFDSLGCVPSMYKGLINYLRTWKGIIKFNKQILQSPISNFCGIHCLFYCYIKCYKNFTLNCIVARYYIKDVDFNDCNILRITKTLYSIDCTIIKKMLITQACD